MNMAGLFLLGLFAGEPAGAAKAAENADAILLLDLVLLGLMLAVGIAIINTRRLFAVAMLSGVYSLLSAAFFVTIDAVDVAFTEAAVGAGVSTTLLLGAMLLTARQARKPATRRIWAPLVACFGMGAALLYAVPDMPAFGDADSPANAYVGQDYLERTPNEIAVPNVVTAVLASYRGYDTFGETVVIFTAGLGVMLLLGLRSPGRDARETPEARARNAMLLAKRVEKSEEERA